MTFKDVVRRSPLTRYGKAIREAPREIILNRHLMLSCFIYAVGGVPVNEIRIFISIVYVGFGVGAALSFLVNDLIGRIWSFRLYTLIWCVGSMMAIFSPNVQVLYAARVIQGLGFGPLTVSGPMSIVEIAPAEIRGLLTSWFLLLMSVGLFGSVFCALGVYRHVPVGNLQFQTVWFTPMVLMALCMIGTFSLGESPRWLFLVHRREEAIASLVKLRGLPVNHPRVERELRDIEDDISRTAEAVRNSSFWTIAKETFTVPSNLRRLQQCIMCYALAQLSGANLITSYLVPVLEIVGAGGNTAHSMFLSGMYGLAKFFFVLIATFFFVDTLGRRNSLFVGAGLQMITHVYLAVYIRYTQKGPVPESASNAAIAALFIHAFGYGVGLYILPYIFGGELWPNRIRSFGGAVGQAFHWLFIYGMQYSMPSILSSFDQWGAFLFFAGWCAVGILYTYFMVPEIAGLSVEEIEELFRGPWFSAHRGARTIVVEGCPGAGADGLDRSWTNDDEKRDGDKC
ncbi:hypothetical protein N8T08_007689 [Aspergillus melleus]|uniref:Uncharacterized protein n=1 Tax=Aspergillus melleus TaxID=138277 RepID=A0ACC3BDY9_9EURO|nr:hypothetical protein N8T08_007689 [Aspergillus melleus]